jgi:hypothetical protein
MNLKISPQAALWYKNNKNDGKDIFTRNRLSGKRRLYNIHQNVAFVTIYLPFLST